MTQPDSSGPPAVSVVIPTFHRPALVVEAVRSALAQDLAALEVIVVVDGRDAATERALAASGDKRLRVLVPKRNLGNAGARNHGISAARADWVALLDDDDAWLPGKLAAQLAAARASALALPIVSCRFLARTATADFVWPRRLPEPGEPVCDYLFTRRAPPTGEGAVQTSTILAPRALFERVPFDPDCRRFVDLDWMLRAVREPGTGLVFARPDVPLSVWSMEDHPRISNTGAWRDDVAWLEARRGLMTPRAAAAFLLTLPSIRAARQGDWRALPALLARALAAGRPSWAELAFHMANFALPPRVKDALARRAARAAA